MSGVISLPLLKVSLCADGPMSEDSGWKQVTNGVSVVFDLPVGNGAQSNGSSKRVMTVFQSKKLIVRCFCGDEDSAALLSSASQHPRFFYILSSVVNTQKNTCRIQFG